MTPSSVGMAWVAMISSSRTLRPRNRSLANANPARVENSTTDTVTVPATTIELVSANAKSVVSKTRAMFWNRWPPGTRTGGTVSIASGVCDDTTNDQYTGNAEPASTATSAAYVHGPATRPASRRARRAGPAGRTGAGGSSTAVMGSPQSVRLDPFGHQVSQAGDDDGGDRQADRA